MSNVACDKLLTTDVLVAVMAPTTWGPPGEILGGFSFGGVRIEYRMQRRPPARLSMRLFRAAYIDFIRKASTKIVANGDG